MEALKGVLIIAHQHQMRMFIVHTCRWCSIFLVTYSIIRLWGNSVIYNFWQVHPRDILMLGPLHNVSRNSECDNYQNDVWQRPTDRKVNQLLLTRRFHLSAPSTTCICKFFRYSALKLEQGFAVKRYHPLFREDLFSRCLHHCYFHANR